MYVYVSPPTVWAPSVSITEQIVIERIWVTLDCLLCVICIRRCDSLLGSISVNWHINIKINIKTPPGNCSQLKCEIYLDTHLLNHAHWRARTHSNCQLQKLKPETEFRCYFSLLCAGVNNQINVFSVSKCLLSGIWLTFHKVYRLQFNSVILFCNIFM